MHGKKSNINAKKKKQRTLSQLKKNHKYMKLFQVFNKKILQKQKKLHPLTKRNENGQLRNKYHET